jgi:hypothetical protein
MEEKSERGTIHVMYARFYIHAFEYVSLHVLIFIYSYICACVMYVFLFMYIHICEHEYVHVYE